MSGKLVTIASYGHCVEASLARDLLERAGLNAFLKDDQTLGIAWHLGVALGGVKLQVQDTDADEACAILAEGSITYAPEDTPALDTSSAEDSDSDSETEEVQTEATSAESNADRALRAAFIGLLLRPLELYALWLILKVVVSRERLGPRHARNAVAAAVIVLFVTAGLCWLVSGM